MNASSGQWIAQFGMMDCLDEYNASVSSESFSSCTTDDIFGKNGGVVIGADPHFSLDNQRPTKLMKTSSGSWGSPPNNNDSSPSSTRNLLSFSNPSNISEAIQYSKGSMLNPKLEIDYEAVTNNHFVSGKIFGEKESQKRHRINRPLTSNPLGQDHVVAERKRRQKLSQRLIALSALIPGLKKMDKASVLGEAARYLKHLQERVTTLEERLKQQNVKSVVLRKTYLSMDDFEGDDEDASSTSSSNQDRNYNKSNPFSEEGAALPEIEVKVVDKEVLLIIHCEKQKGLLGKILNEMEKLQFCVTNTNSMPFGNHDSIITLTAQMKAEHSIAPRELVRKLRPVF